MSQSEFKRDFVNIYLGNFDREYQAPSSNQFHQPIGTMYKGTSIK